MACTCTEIVAGAMGLAKAAVGADRAPDAIVAQRRGICRECPEATRSADPARLAKPTKGLTSLSRCRACGCFIAAKTLLASESCPLNKW